MNRTSGSSITFGRAIQWWSGAEFRVTETLHRAGLRLPLHDHASANVTIVLRGGFDERVEQRSFSAQRGSVIVKPAGARHRNVYGARSVEALTIEVPDSVHLGDTRHFHAPMLALAAERLRDELSIGDAASAIAAEELMRQIAAAAQGRVHEPEARPDWLATVEQMLRDDHLPRSLSALSAAVGRHPAHVAREFRAHYGCTVGAFVRARRIDTAREALRRSDRSIAEIALDAGFYDQSHFTNTFRRLLGTTPERYRARNGTRHRPRRR
jgi:AraC family transcriptional regulator